MSPPASSNNNNNNNNNNNDNNVSWDPIPWRVDDDDNNNNNYNDDGDDDEDAELQAALAMSLQRQQQQQHAAQVEGVPSNNMIMTTNHGSPGVTATVEDGSRVVAVPDRKYDSNFFNMDGDEEEEETALQEALALSLQQQQQQQTSTLAVPIPMEEDPPYTMEEEEDGTATAAASPYHAFHPQQLQQQQQYRIELEEDGANNRNNNNEEDDDENFDSLKEERKYLLSWESVELRTDNDSVGDGRDEADRHAGDDDQQLQQQQQFLHEIYCSAEPFTIAAFHNLMWNSALTTENDKGRWLSQGIDVRPEPAKPSSPRVQVPPQRHDASLREITTVIAPTEAGLVAAPAPPTTTPVETTTASTTTSTTTSGSSSNSSTTTHTTHTSTTSTTTQTSTNSRPVNAPVAAVAATVAVDDDDAEEEELHNNGLRRDVHHHQAEHELQSHPCILKLMAEHEAPCWGLQQQHGGPCGVLAAVQAEMIRIFMLSPAAVTAAATTTTSMKQQQWQQSQQDKENQPPPPPVDAAAATSKADEGFLTPLRIRHALAQAIAIVLARAALTPPAAAATQRGKATNATTVSMDGSNDPDPDTAKTPRNDYGDDDDEACVRIVLPIHLSAITSTQAEANCLTWQDLEPWTSSTTTTPESIRSSSLMTYSISCPRPSTSTRQAALSCVAETDSNGGTSAPPLPPPPPMAGFKRQKMAVQNACDFTCEITAGMMDVVDVHDDDEQQKQQQNDRQRLRRLAQAVYRFLILPEQQAQLQHQSSSQDEGGLLDIEEGRSNHARERIILPRASPLDCLRQPGGVLLLVMSLVASRGAATITQEWDDPVGTRLTAQFGHCSQELINLLLTGQAVSNVFDNTMTVSGEMVCYGIQAQSSIGYLSELEALRYVEVGSYYKSPRVPIWVVGSTSHFTVLYGEMNALRESRSDVLLEQCRRAFKSVEGGGENGFIATDQLAAVLSKLHLQLSNSTVLTLGAALEVGCSGIILWDDFWKATSRLMMGASVESVLQSGPDGIPFDTTQGPASHTLIGIDLVDQQQQQQQYGHGPYVMDDSPLPLLLTNYPYNSGTIAPATAAANDAAAAAATFMKETDEQMARRLQEEWDRQPGGGNGGMEALSEAAVRVASPMDMDLPADAGGSHHDRGNSDALAMTDEELARKLQAEWDSELSGGVGGGGGGGSVTAVNGSPATVASDDGDISALSNPPNSLLPQQLLFPQQQQQQPQQLVDSLAFDMDSKPPAVGRPPKADFEKYGDTFTLYHYNGLRGGILTPFRITRLRSEEAVGASIALNRTGGSAATHTAASGDLEDVLRTKWPSCIIDWCGKPPPYID